MDLLISYINSNMDRNVWINAKSTMAMEIQAEINFKKKSLTIGRTNPKGIPRFYRCFLRGKGSMFSGIKTLGPQNRIEGHLYP